MTNEIIINLTAKDTATGKVVSLTEALKALKVAGDKASKGSKGIQDAQDKLRKSTDDATTALSKLTGSIGRIAFYRAVRDAIRRVTQGLVEGTNNLVMYSAAMNSMDASQANRTMSEFASISLWVKDTIASALMPILQSLVPVVQTVAEVFVFATNAINQFIKALQGGTVWTKALKYPVDYAESLNGVGRAAKEAKKQIFGFDELNIFNAPTTGGSGSTPALDYSSLFTEEKNIDPGISNFAEIIKNNLAEIESAVGTFALAAGAILLLTGHTGIGITAFAAGAALKWKEAGVNWDSLGATVTQKLNNLIAFTSPVILAMGLLLAFSPKHLPLALGMIATGALGMSFSASTGLTDGLSAELKEKLTDIELVVSLFSLATGAILAMLPGTMGIGLALLAAGAVGMGAGVALKSDALTGTIKDNLLAIEMIASGFVLAIGLLTMLVPGHEFLSFGLIIAGAVGLNYGAVSISKDFIPNEIKNTLGMIIGIAGGFMLALGLILLLFVPSAQPQGFGLLMAGIGALSFSERMMDGNGLLSWIKTKLGEIGDAFGNWLNERIESWNETVEEFKKIFTDFIPSLLGIATKLGEDMIENIKSGVSAKWEGFKSWLSGKKLNINANVNTTGSGSGYTFSGRATGGFVDSGQMFMARENGIPEMVGSIGNQTAVANNGQIIEGIAAGVANAMNNTNSAIYQMANAVVDAIANKEINTTVISDRDIYQSAQRGKTLSGRTVYA